MNLNLPSDIEKKVDNITISLPFKNLSVRNMLKNQIPTKNDFITHGNSHSFRVRPGDGSINFRQRTSNAGVSWQIDFQFQLVDNNLKNFNVLNRFTNRKVAIVIGTSTYKYWIGTEDQLLNFIFRETLSGFQINISGDIYFPAARERIQSFRSTY